MKITQEELERRLSSKTNLCNHLINKEVPKKGNDENNRNNAGRKEDVPNAPKSLRVVAGVLSTIEGNSVTVAKSLNLSPEQVRYARNNGQVKHTEKEVQAIALTRLMDAMGLITPEDLADQKPKDLAVIAANLSRVHKNLAIDTRYNEQRENNVNITIYSPKQRSASDYETIEVQAAAS